MLRLFTLPPCPSPEELERASWINCGPAAVCAVTGLSPDQLRPHLGDFERKGYTNPTLMFALLRELGLQFERCRLGLDWPRFGLVRIQWHGPWMNPGVPMRARYRQTHWVAAARDIRGATSPIGIYDVNAGNWTDLASWERVIVPLITSHIKRADGKWSITHAIEVRNGGQSEMVRRIRGLDAARKAVG